MRGAARLLGRIVWRLALLGTVVTGVLAVTTMLALRPVPDVLPPDGLDDTTTSLDVRDRHGRSLVAWRDARWNVHDRVILHELPPLLVRAFIEAEDRRFFEHRGGDWHARFAAVLQNLRAGRAVRGASTISEQTVRIIRPRPRNLWSRWLESWEVRRLEAKFSKAEILAFYLDQVPYARNRRGVVQAARLYFDRDLRTLSVAETLALAVLVRSPSRLDPLRDPARVLPAVGRLATRLEAVGMLTSAEHAEAIAAPLSVRPPSRDVEADHFVAHVRNQRSSRAGLASRNAVAATTTLDGGLQGRVQDLLDARLRDLASLDVGDGAVLVVDHRSDEILAWVNGGGFTLDRDAGHLDKVLSLRQPGSSIKPFIYAMALMRGWTPATVLDDEPLRATVGHGEHRFRNYSRRHYGPVRLRSALGSSLNIPAVLAARFVTPAAALETLRALGFESLDRSSDIYGDGIALGTGEVRLLDLVEAYATLARGGVRRPLRWDHQVDAARPARRIFDAETSALVADILADPGARALEFERDSVLAMPRETAVKTGTSNDYRDAWAVGFSHRYTVGVWMGNADRRPMRGVSGTIGPALVLRAVFADLDRDGETRPLPSSRRLAKVTVCAETGRRAGAACPRVDELFHPDHPPDGACTHHRSSPEATVLLAEAPTADAGTDTTAPTPHLRSPTPGLHLALDPRIPDDLEAFPFEVETSVPPVRVEWWLDGRLAARRDDGERRWLWHPRRGEHRVHARLYFAGAPEAVDTETVAFLVK